MKIRLGFTAYVTSDVIDISQADIDNYLQEHSLTPDDLNDWDLLAIAETYAANENTLDTYLDVAAESAFRNAMNCEIDISTCTDNCDIVWVE